MPRSKGSEMLQQRQSPRAPLHLKMTSSAESNGVHRPVRDRSPKLEEHRRSPRSPLPEIGVCNQKKRGTRVSDLESRLGHAKDELKKLKEQLASAENAKRDAQQELEETKKLIPVKQVQQEEQNGGEVEEVINPVPSPPERDAEVAPPMKEESPVPVASIVSNVDDGVGGGAEAAKEEVIDEVLDERIDEANVKESASDSSNEKPAEVAVVVPESDPTAPKEEQQSLVKGAEGEALVAKDEAAKEESEIKRHIAENAALKKELEEMTKAVAAAKARDEEMGEKTRSLIEELDESKVRYGRLEEQLEAVEIAKAQLEMELKRLRIQTDQWRKAADAAADIISADGGLGMDYSGSGGGGGGRRMSERCGSMDKHLNGGIEFETPGNMYLGSPLMGGELDEGMGNGKRKSGGIRMLGELWKKKGNQK